MRGRAAASLALAGWMVALVGYFGPWVGSRPAALAWNAYDLFDLMRLLPEVETGAIRLSMQTLRLPLLGLAGLLPLLTAELTTRRLWRGLALLWGEAMVVATLPPYPYIVGAWRTPGWCVPFWWGIAMGIALPALTWAAPHLGPYRLLPRLLLALTPLPAVQTFLRLLPPLSRLRAEPIAPGWGFWLCGLGFLLIVAGTPNVLTARRNTP